MWIFIFCLPSWLSADMLWSFDLSWPSWIFLQYILSTISYYNISFLPSFLFSFFFCVLPLILSSLLPFFCIYFFIHSSIFFPFFLRFSFKLYSILYTFFCIALFLHSSFLSSVHNLEANFEFEIGVTKFDIWIIVTIAFRYGVDRFQRWQCTANELKCR